MNPLRGQMASMLMGAAKSGLQQLDVDSPIAQKIKKLDVQSLLEEDIRRICDAISWGETTRLMGIVAKLKMGGSSQEPLKEEIKKIAKGIVERVEQGHDKLKTPPDLRDLLFNL
ncbi:MAG: hypothetical protein HQL19_00515 [Candidatus Omnitrophica bacterium]|nr:hypothetical protein [Candidatus Omnitrophota bacterium]